MKSTENEESLGQNLQVLAYKEDGEQL